MTWKALYHHYIMTSLTFTYNSLPLLFPFQSHLTPWYSLNKPGMLLPIPSIWNHLLSNLWSSFLTSFQSLPKCHFLIRCSLKPVIQNFICYLSSSLFPLPSPLFLLMEHLSHSANWITFFSYVLFVLLIFPHLIRTEILSSFFPTDITYVFTPKIKPGT